MHVSEKDVKFRKISCLLNKSKLIKKDVTYTESAASLLAETQLKQVYYSRHVSLQLTKGTYTQDLSSACATCLVVACQRDSGTLLIKPESFLLLSGFSPLITYVVLLSPM